MLKPSPCMMTIDYREYNNEPIIKELSRKIVF
jgi:hypothetical protein